MVAVLFMQGNPGSTSELVRDLMQLVWEGLALGIAYGLVAMVVIQFLKDAWLREWFNRKRFNAWFVALYREAAMHSLDLYRSKSELVWLAAAGDERMLFSLPIDKMAGQIGVAVNAILEAPQRYVDLIFVLGQDAAERREGAQDAAILVETDPARLRVSKERDESEVRMRYADARTRVAHRVQRQIDLLQLRSMQRWTSTNRYLAVLISTSIGMAPLYLRPWLAGRYGTFRLISILPASILLSLIGGLLAPLLRDLAARQTQRE